MRILHIVSAPAAGGAEVYVKDLAKSLVEKKHSVIMAFLGRACDIGRSEGYEEEFLKELDEAGVEWFFVGNECRKKPWLGVTRIRQLVKSEGIDVYHSHLPFAVPFGFSLRIPRFYTHHSINPRLNWIMYRVFNRLIDRYVGISKICSEKLSSYSGRQVTSILNGVDSSKFLARTVVLPDSRNVVRAIAVGRIHPHKGYYFLGEVIKALPDWARAKFLIRIAGEGDVHYTRQLKQFLNQSGVGESFEFLGNRSDIPQLLNESDLFLMSSEQEGLPISLIEATVAGLPCIVTDVGGCPEIIGMCENGLAVTYGDVDAYASALLALVQRPDQLRLWAANSQKNVEAFDIDLAASRHLELYTEFLQG